MSVRDVAPPARRRLLRILSAVALLLGIALLVVWGVRKPIAEHVIGRTLAARGVPARYTLADLGLGRQRLTNVVIGDPAHPDLVADWIETETGIGLSGPDIAGVRIGHARIRAQLIDGRLSLGSLDRLLPAPSGKPFALPAIDARIADARIRLETPQGLVGLRLAGAGRLDDGFRGSLAAVSDALREGACVTGRASAALTIRTARSGPTLAGPVRIDTLACGGVRATGIGADVTATLAPRLDGARGTIRLGVARVRQAALAVNALGGTVAFASNAGGTTGTLDLATGVFATREARGGRLAAAGRYVIAGGTMRYDGNVGARDVSVAPARLTTIARMVGHAAGTPMAPLLDRLVRSAVAAGRRFDLDATIAASVSGGVPRITASQAAVSAASGARIGLTGASVGYDGARMAVGRAQLRFGGGGLPDGTAAIMSAGQGYVARAIVRPYAAGGATLALSPVRIAVAGGRARLVADVNLSGPVGDGRVDGLTMPLDLRWNDGLVGNPGCTAVSLQRLAVSGLVLTPSRITLCPIGGALLRSGPSGTVAAAQFGTTALSGTIGRTPLTLAASGGRITAQGFALQGVAARIGTDMSATRIDVAQLAGRIAQGGAGGTFAGAGGLIGTVPLRMGEAAGDWRFADGRLVLAGKLTVSDTDPTARFRPLRAQDVAFTLAGDAITATATLYEPTRSVKVADVTIAHGLGSGAGHADLNVPNLAFTKDFQPDLLTPLTTGVIAEVRGSIDGAGHIAWTPDGVTSTGDFHTGDTDLAAAVGPVTGIAGRIHFTDLLALQSAPGQIATVRTINPGIPVSDGTIRYQTLPGARVQVEGAEWPFAGGRLTLDPTLLDFSAPGERRMTFHVAGIAADQFLQQFDFKNLDASGVFDGVLPMIFDATGGRIEGGSLAVREGGGTLAYVGAISEKDLGTWANIAFQALKSLRYRSLEIVMNGPLAGEMITEVKFAGISQGKGAKSNFLIRRLQKLPLVFNIRIKAPFRGLLDSAQSFYDPKRLVQRNLPALLEEQDKRATAPATPIQPSASRTVP